MRLLGMTLLLAVFGLPQSADRLVRFGPNARVLTDVDLAAIQALSEMDGREPWAIKASQGWGGWGAQVFFPADHVAPGLRRGPMLGAVARTGPNASPPEPRPWSTSSVDRWAQIPRADSDPDVLTGPRDLNRPFRVRAELSDADLIAIVRLIRSSPSVSGANTWPPGPDRPPVAVHGDWPVLIVLDAEGGSGIYVATVGRSPRENTGQGITLERSAEGWTVTFVGTWWAD